MAMRPTPEQAQAALAEAAARAAGVRRSDRQLGSLLYAVAAMWVAAAAVFSLFPRGGLPVSGIALLAILATGVAAMVFIGVRIKAFSRWGLVWFVVSIGVFSVWAAVVDGVSMFSGFWSRGQSGSHLLISVAIDAIPLVIAGWLVGRRR